MTRKEAIAVLECLALEMNAILAGTPKSEATADQIKRCIDAYDMAISALRQQEHFRDLTKKVEPLTLDELREAAETGDPVWLVQANCSSWVVIEKVDDRKYIQLVDYAEFGSDEPYDFAISDYGDSFKAYRQKPEEDDHDERKENEHV